MALLFCAIALFSLGGDPLPVRVVSGILAADGSLSLTACGLGDGGLLPRERWHAGAERLDRGRVRTRGGAVVSSDGATVQVALPAGRSFSVDGRARLVVNGELLTQPGLAGLGVRLHDGTEVRVQSGNTRGPREVSVYAEGTEYLLVRGGRPLGGQRRARPFYGLRYYVTGGGDEFVSLTLVGPLLHVRPLAPGGGAKAMRVVLLGDLIRQSLGLLRDETPAASVQYPLALRQARFLADLIGELLPPDRVLDRQKDVAAGVGLVIGLGPELRWVLMPPRDEGSELLVFALFLEDAADATLEFVSTPTVTSLRRVLPASQQHRSRYLGRGVDLDEAFDRYLPWELPLGHPAQRREALRDLAPFLMPRPAVDR